MSAAEEKHGTVIMVDDDITNLKVAANALADTYNFFTAPSGAKLFEIIRKITPDLILLDVEMPDMDGYEVIKLLKSDEKTANIPVIFLTAKISPEHEAKGLDLGAVDYIFKPFSRELLIRRIDLHMLLETQKKELMKHSRVLETEIDRKTRAVFELQNTILKTVAELVERRDSVTGGHIERTQYYLRLLVGLLIENGVYRENLSEWDMNLFIMSSQLHDVGKISIKDDILMKPGKLTIDEFSEMKKHTLFGAEIIRSIEESTTENEFLKYAETMAVSHHEKWNGTGYPYSLKGEEIPLMGRLMAIVDVYDALTNERPYKNPFSHDEAIEIVKEGLGSHFDPLICEVFLRNADAFKNAKTDHPWDRKLQSMLEISSALKLVANIVDTRGGFNRGRAERNRRRLEILLDALMEHARFKDEVSKWDKDLLLISAQLHDVGKIAVTDQILNKKDKLTKEEFEEVKNHVEFGMDVIRQIAGKVDNGGMLHHAEAMVGSHHEKWDGTGYPNGLKGEEIPLQGRLMAIVDVYDALTTIRPHRDMIPYNEAAGIIKNCAGTHFDPELVEIFLEYEKEFENV